MSNLKKYDFNFNLSGLQDYTEQKTNTLISETILTGDFASLVTVVPNVKGTQELNILSSTLAQLDGGCGWDPANSGQTTTYTQKSIASVKKQYQERNVPCVVEMIPRGGSYSKKIMEYVKEKEIDMVAIAYHSESLLPQFDTFAQSLITNENNLPCMILKSKQAGALYF
jgi:nucleotide-binding universal stress UspA family protein